MSPTFRPISLLGRIVVSVLVLSAVAVGSSCSSGEDDSAPADDVEDAVTSTSAAPSDTVADAVEPEVVMVRSYASPTDAGTELFAVWRTGDAAAAAGMAPPEAVFELFSIGADPSAKNRGCDDGEFGSAACFFSNGQGGVNITLTPGPDGWQVESIDAF